MWVSEWRARPSAAGLNGTLWAAVEGRSRRGTRRKLLQPRLGPELGGGWDGSAWISGRTNRLPILDVVWRSRAERPWAYVWVLDATDLASAVLPWSCLFLSQAPRGPLATWILFLPNVVSSCVLLRRAASSSELCTRVALCRKRWVWETIALLCSGPHVRLGHQASAQPLSYTSSFVSL